MTPDEPAWRRAPAPRGLAAAVLLLHLGALWLLHEASRQPATPGSTAPRLSLRWITEPPPSAAPLPTAPEVPEADAGRRRRVPPEQSLAPTARPAADPRPALPAPAAAPQPISAGLSPPGPPTPSASAASTPAALAPLRLNLPREALPGLRAQDPPARQARSDPRSNSAAAGPADPLQRALEGGPASLTEEDRGSGRRRLRLGRDCVDLQDSRAAGLDPFQSATRPAPKLAESCR